jgi:hypothetical protein
MALSEQELTYTPQQAEDLDRALEAQYQADKKRRPPVHEYAEWQRVRRAAAQRRFQRANHRTA